MYDFNYVRVSSLKDAAEQLKKAQDASLLAGGMTLIPTLKLRLAQPSDVIDLSGIKELRGIKTSGTGVVIGAMTPHAEVAVSADVQKAIPALARLAGRIGDPQVRHRGTIGGSVANNDPAADYPAAVLALDAAVVTNKREIAAGDYFQGMFATALEEGEIIVSIKFNIPKRAAYEKFPHPASGYAMAGVFVAEGAKGLRVAVTGAASGVFRWEAAEKALAKKMSVDALEGVELATDDMNEDIHATREYRANLARVMTKRALQKLLAA